MSSDEMVAIVGAGTMGWQIALQLAAYGTRIRLFDRDETVTRASLDQIASEGPRLADLGALPEGGLDAVTRVETTASLAEAVSDAWFVIEAIPERVDLKRAFFAEVSRLAPKSAILATNSSSFKSRLLVGSTLHPERLLNAHFYNVPWQRSAVELMSCGVTDSAVIERLAAFLRNRGLVPVVAKAESTGFIYNRIWRAIKRESLRVAAEGVATPEEVDRLWCLANGASLGPFARMDLVGLDVVLDIERHYAAESGDPADEPPAFLREMVERGRLGRKTGEGFYRYPNPPFERPGWPRE